MPTGGKHACARTGCVNNQCMNVIEDRIASVCACVQACVCACVRGCMRMHFLIGHQLNHNCTCYQLIVVLVCAI